MGAVFYFENDEPSRSIEFLFEMELENLYIMGEKTGSNKFSFKLGPRENTYKMLKPVDDSVPTSI